MHPDADRLFAQDEALRTEGKAVLAASGIGRILEEAGFIPVGSQVMGTMTWRDMDFERCQDEPDWDDHCDLGNRLARTGWCVRLHCVNDYREREGGAGFYWGLRVADPSRPGPAPKEHPDTWKVDAWTARPHEFSTAGRRRWDELMTQELRAEILAIKEVVSREPEYRKTMLSVHIYEAVLERGVRGVQAFRQWWRSQI